jgi:predicted Zn-ribbon and HTH transcriptional regulator
MSIVEGKGHPEVARRIALCGRCVHLIPNINVCKKCGCFMPAKTRLSGARCPIGKWEKIEVKDITEE